MIDVQNGTDDMSRTLVHMHMKPRLILIYPKSIRIIRHQMHMLLFIIMIHPRLDYRLHLEQCTSIEILYWLE